MDRSAIIKLKKLEASELNRFVEFSLGEDSFVIPLSLVREIINTPKLEAFHDSPNYFLGHIDHRSHALSVIHLKTKLNLQNNIATEHVTQTIIIDLGGMMVGFTVDEIKKVHSFYGFEMKELDSVESAMREAPITGAFVTGQNILYALDLTKLLSSEDIEIVRGRFKKAA